MKIVPSHLTALLDRVDAARLFPAKWIVVGGETFDGRLLTRIDALAPPCRVLNHYGPTETTIGSLVFRADGDAISGLTTVPIGFPITNSAAYVLDAEGQVMPCGVVAELYIGGAGVSRGYLNAPDQTAARFVPDPYSRVAGARLYRTGDRVRRRLDGSIEFLGRVDGQVK